MTTSKKRQYENNPFYIGFNGLKLFFANAQSVAIYAIVLSFVLLIINGASNVADITTTLSTSEQELAANDQQVADAVRDFFAQDAGSLAIIGVIAASAVFFLIAVWLLMYGALEYTGARLALGHKVAFVEAFREVAKELASYIWLYILILVKVLLWSLLFVIPGLIMAVRYMLAGTVFFAEGKRGNAAIQRSLELTKGAWFTTFAGFNLWNIMTFNTITSLVLPGSAAVLYRQLRDVTDAGEQKPAAHWLSWLTFFVPIALALLFMSIIVIAAIAFTISMAP